MPEVTKRKRLAEDSTKKESLSFDEVNQVLESCKSLKQKTLLELAVSTAIRREDIVGIELNNIDLDNRKLQFYETKKKRYWEVPLEPKMLSSLKMYINGLPNDARYLFPSEQSNAKHLSGKTAYNWLQSAMADAKIDGTMDFHGLRRTFVRLSRRMGRDIKYCQEMTGDTVDTLLKHYDGWSTEEMAEDQEKNSLLDRVDMPGAKLRMSDVAVEVIGNRRK